MFQYQKNFYDIHGQIMKFEAKNVKMVSNKNWLHVKQLLYFEYYLLLEETVIKNSKTQQLITIILSTYLAHHGPAKIRFHTLLKH